jgi:hypothetical protein
MRLLLAVSKTAYTSNKFFAILEKRRRKYNLQVIDQLYRFLYPTVVYRRHFFFLMVLISEALM